MITSWSDRIDAISAGTPLFLWLSCYFSPQGQIGDSAEAEVGTVDEKHGRLRVRVSSLGSDPVSGKRRYRTEYEPGTGTNGRNRGVSG